MQNYNIVKYYWNFMQHNISVYFFLHRQLNLKHIYGSSCIAIVIMDYESYKSELWNKICNTDPNFLGCFKMSAASMPDITNIWKSTIIKKPHGKSWNPQCNSFQDLQYSSLHCPYIVANITSSIATWLTPRKKKEFPIYWRYSSNHKP